MDFITSGGMRHIDTSEIARTYGNGHEYELYPQIIALFNQASNEQRQGFLRGNILPAYFEQRFGGPNEHLLLREHNEISGFPDFAVVRETIVIVFDHFRIDASKPIKNATGNHGTSYASMLGKLKPDSSQMLERLCIEQKIEFSKRYLMKNLEYAFRKHAAKQDRYFNALDAHFCTIGTDESLHDREKPKELWLVIEDNTPSSLIEQIGKELSHLLCEYPTLTGLLLIHLPIPGTLPTAMEQMCLVANNESGRSFLERLSTTDDH